MANSYAANHVRVNAESLQQFTESCFLAEGFAADDAKLATEVLLWASLRGVDTHGVRNLKRYYVDAAGGVGQRDGVILPDAQLTVDREDETTIAFNANGGLGLSMSVRAMRRTIAKAAEQGVAVATVRNSTHFGPAGYYAHMALEHDMIGFASTGYLFPLGQPKSVLPFGGLLPMLSTNPIAMACPAAEQADFVFDAATSVVPVNRVELIEEAGVPLPTDWARDDQHRPTADPDAVHGVNPLGGGVEYGGHKGFGFAMAAWIMTSLLAGGWRTDPPADRILGRKETTPEGYAQQGVGHCFAAIRIDRFADVEHFKQGMDAAIVALNRSPAAPGFEQVFVAGQRAAASEQERRRDGVPIAPSTLAEFRQLSEKFQVPLPTIESESP